MILSMPFDCILDIINEKIGLLWLSNYCDGNGGYDGIDNYIANNNNDDYDDDDDIQWMRQLEWSIMREWFIAPPPSNGENKSFRFSFFWTLLNMIQFAHEKRYYVSKNQQQIQHSLEQFINT